MQIIQPHGASSPRNHTDSTLVKVLGGAFRWRSLLEIGVRGTVDEIDRAEGINPSCVSRILCLTLPAPGLVAAILDDRQPPESPGRGRPGGQSSWARAREAPARRRTRIALRNPFAIM